MFRAFFLDPRWFGWSILGSALILVANWYQVELYVKINEWFGEFYNLIQKALGKPGAVTFDEYIGQLMTFGKIAALYVMIAVVVEFFTKHYVFRWRTAMNDYYMRHWPLVRHIEGASQRVQEDTMRFARIMEGLGVSFMRSVLTLIAFLPILWGPVGAGQGVALDRPGGPCPRLRGHPHRAGRHCAAGRRGLQAARAGVPQPARGGGLPQGAGAGRGPRRPRRPAQGQRAVQRRAAQLFPAVLLKVVST